MQPRVQSVAPLPEHQLAAVVRLAPIIVFALDERGVFTLSDGRGLAALGVRSGDVVGQSVFELYADYPSLLEDVRHALDGDDVCATHQVGASWFEIRFTPIVSGSGELQGTLGVATDVTATEEAARELASDIASRRLAEERLARSEADFRALIECSADAIAVQSDGVLSYVNPALVQYLGYDDSNELCGRSVLTLFLPEERSALLKRLESVVSSGEPSSVMEHALCRRDGTVLTAQVAIVRVSFRGQPATLITARDLTERRRMQAQLRAADRMATVGTLTASIAHEINNPLAALVGNLELLDTRIEPGEIVSSADREVLRDAREAAARLCHIVRDLRSFTHWDDEKRTPVDVGRVLDSALKLAANELRNRVSVERDYRVIPLVDANEVRLGQVFLNVIVNAAQSFGDRPAEHNQIRISTRSVASLVIVEIADTGSGIAPSVVGRIFEPLFTTKPIGVGSGLGLAICKSIVTALGGEIQVRSEFGKGSVFRITLPASTAASTAPRSVWPARASLARRRVLVIDDEPMIVRILRRALQGQHDVTVLGSASDALLEIVQGRQFDVIFCDLMMPNMSGMEFYDHLCRSAPELAERVVFMSGGVSTKEGRAFIDQFADRHLPKPFDLGQVDAMLERYGSLDAAASPRVAALRR